MVPDSRSTRLTAGLKCAPETAANSRMSATSAPAVATAFSSSCSPTSLGDRRVAMMPEPTTAMTRTQLPSPSATRRRWSGTCCVPTPVSGPASNSLMRRKWRGCSATAAGRCRFRLRHLGGAPCRRAVRIAGDLGSVSEHGVELPQVVGAVHPCLVLHRVATRHVLLDVLLESGVGRAGDDRSDAVGGADLDAEV